LGPRTDRQRALVKDRDSDFATHGAALSAEESEAAGFRNLSLANSKIMGLSAFGTTLDNAAAIDTNRTLQVGDLLQCSVPACARLTRRAFDVHYSNVGTRVASPPDRPLSRRASGPGILAVIADQSLHERMG